MKSGKWLGFLYLFCIFAIGEFTYVEFLAGISLI